MARKAFEFAMIIAGKVSSSFGTAFMSANDKLQKMIVHTQALRQDLKNLEKAQKQVARVNELQEQMANTRVKFEAARSKVKELSLELLRSERPTRELKTAFKEASAEADRLGKTLARQEAELEKLKSALSQAGYSGRDLSAEYARLTNQLEKAKYAQERFAAAVRASEKIENFRQSMRGYLLDAAQYAVALGAPIKIAMDFESAMADVRKVVDFDTPEQFKAMGKDIMNLSKRIPMTATGLAQIVAAGGQAGIAREELVAFAETAAKMGVAFDITAEEAGQTMAQWRSAFKMNQKEVTTLADQINYLGNTTAASAPKISEVVKRIGPLGRVGGAAAGEIAALGATIVSAGIDEEIAATGIKNLILGLVAGEGATKSQAQAFKTLGLDAVQMAKMMQKDARGAILRVLQALQKLPEYKRAAVLTDLFGKESVGAIAPLLTNLEKLEDNFNKVGDKAKYAGSMEAEFKARSATTANSLQLLQNRIVVLGDSIGTIMLPWVIKLSDYLSIAADWVQRFTEKHPKLANVIVKGTMAVFGLTIGLTALGYVVSTLIMPFVRFYVWANKIGLVSKLTAIATKAWAGAQWAWNVAMSTGRKLLSVGRLILYKAATKAISIATRAWAAAQWILNVALSANPIGLVILAVAGLVVGLVLLYKRSEKVRNAVNSLWNGLKSGAALAINFAIDKINALISALNKIPGVKIAKLPTIQISRHNEKAASKIARHATGTANWRGGLTWINERGGEIVDLPRGTRIIPHDVAMEMARGGGINITYSPQIIIQGGGPDVRNHAEQGARAAFNDFKNWWERMQRQEARLSFG